MYLTPSSHTNQIKQMMKLKLLRERMVTAVQRKASTKEETGEAAGEIHADGGADRRKRIYKMFIYELNICNIFRTNTALPLTGCSLCACAC